jgi:hypothetical protein
MSKNAAQRVRKQCGIAETIGKEIALIKGDYVKA